jgi:hypothetical protein
LIQKIAMSSSEAYPRTIQIFLPSGKPSGIRIAELTTRIVQAVAVPRTQLSALNTRQESEHVGVYFLFGDAGDEAKPAVYIGQTEDLRGRLKNHHERKDFWDTAVFLISRTHSFTQAHIRYLEWEFIRITKDAGRYRLENGNAGSKPHVTEAIEADLKDVIDTSRILMGALGYPVLESLSDPSPSTGANTDNEIYHLRNKEMDAQMRVQDEGYVVLKGSKAKGRLNASVKPDGFIHSTRRKLLQSGILVEEGGHLIFTENYLFKTPSGAGGLVYGGGCNGWKHWKTATGQSLDERLRGDEPS